jgi:hypothetical protein
MTDSSEYGESTGDETQPHQKPNQLLRMESELVIDMNSEHQNKSKTIKLPLHNDILLEARAAARQPTVPYDKLLEDSLFAVAAGLIGEVEQLHIPIVDTESRADLNPRLMKLLASIPKQLMYQLVAGNIEQATSNDKDMAELFAPDSVWLEPSAEEDTPLVYARILVDGQSQTPTSAQYTAVIARLREYISGDPKSYSSAAKLDSDNRHQVTAGDIRRGDYRWLEGQPKRVQVVETFCMALPTRIKDGTIKTPQMYIGYTKDPEKHRKQHDKGDSSGWLQQLVLAAFEAEFPDNGFHIAHREICYMAFQWEVGLAEAFLTILTDSYYETGGGFNVVPGGIQVTSSKFQKLKDAERQQLWNARAHWRHMHTGWWFMNMKNEKKQLAGKNNAALLPELQQVQYWQAQVDAKREARKKTRDTLPAHLAKGQKELAQSLREVELLRSRSEGTPQVFRDRIEQMWNMLKTEEQKLKDIEDKMRADAPSA